MQRRRVLGISILGGFSLLLAACGKTQEPPGKFMKTLGDTPAGAPLPASQTDRGILQDPSSYQPAALAGLETPALPSVSAPAGGEPSPGAAATPPAGEPAAEAREVVIDLLDGMQDGEVELVLKAFTTESLGPLAENHEFLWGTQEAFANLIRAVEDALGPEEADRLQADLRKLAVDPLSIEMVNAETAAVTPAPLLPLLGVELSPQEMVLARVGGAWQVRLDPPLTDADVQQISTYHRTLQDELWGIGDALDDGDVTDRQAVYGAVLRAAQGQAVELGGEGTEVDLGEMEVAP